MKVENITNYGKGFIEVLPELNKLKKQIAIPMGKVLFREIGLIGILRFIWKTAVETKKMKAHDWSDFEVKHGITKENINLHIEDFSIMKVMIDMFGEEKAMKTMSDMLRTGNEHVARKSDKNLLLMAVEEFKSFSDSFASFKEYLKAGEKAMEQERVHKFDIVEDTNDSFAFNIKYCLMHEIAKELGNTKFCFISCHADDVVLPQIGPELGFQYMRSGSLGSGASYCDFRFKRI
ncbi:MAG: L-2-amino-thiazoline-4-carboxylic acid hydrolase [Desulfobacterales bacterium]|nr:L-2-amino-thiazoline-4-carboxylic acid hydrolase [Desulfobacterales bacterium]